MAIEGERISRDRPAIATLRRAFRFLRRAGDTYSNRQLALAFTLIVGGASSIAATPVLLKLAIDSLGRGSATPLPVLLLISLYAGIQCLGRMFGELRLLAFGQAEQRLRRNLSRMVAGHVLDLPLRFHVDRRTGAVGESIAQGLRGYQFLLQHALFTIVPVAVEIILVAIVLLTLGHDLFLTILVASGLAYAAAFTRGAMRISNPARSASHGNIDAQASLTDSLLNYETIKYFAAEKMVVERYDGLLARTESAWRTFYRRRAGNGLVVATIFATSLCVSLSIAGYAVTAGTMTVGDFVLVNAYLLRIVQPLEMAGYAVRDVAQGAAMLERMLAMLEEQAEEPSPNRIRRSIDGELSFEGVSFGYGSRKVLDDVSFQVPRGHTVALVGASGSGKSSLVRLLFRLYEPDSGRILIDGSAIGAMSLAGLRRSIAVVAQDTMLFDDSIAGNILIGRPNASRSEVEQAARIADLHELISRLPEGYETRVGERGLRLSGGERQRLAIARAALKGSRILVFDEATSSLDSRTEQGILTNLRELASARTTFVIAHRLSTVTHADEILVLHDSRIVERGSHLALLRLDGHYARLWSAQQGQFASSCRPGDSPLPSPAEC